MRDAPFVWMEDPVEIALHASRQKRWSDGLRGPERSTSGLPGAYCAEVGRDYFLAELQFSDWVLRRFERVHLERERSVTRQITDRTYRSGGTREMQDF